MSDFNNIIRNYFSPCCESFLLIIVSIHFKYSSLAGADAYCLWFARWLRSDSDRYGRYGQHHEIHLLQENQNAAS